MIIIISCLYKTTHREFCVGCCRDWRDLSGSIVEGDNYDDCVDTIPVPKLTLGCGVCSAHKSIVGHGRSEYFPKNILPAAFQDQVH